MSEKPSAKIGSGKPGPGRPKGSRNKITEQHRKTISALAADYTEDALRALVDVARNGQDGPRVSAANALLDRAYGKPTQPISGDEDSAPLKISVITRRIVDPKG